jgi:hypothetical protein
MITAPSGSTSSAPSRERPRYAGFRHSIAGATRPAAHGSTSSSWGNSLAGCSPSSDRHLSALCATRSPSEVPQSSASRNLWAPACCRPLYWTAPRGAWTPETSGRMSCCPEVARAVCSAAELVVGKGRQAPIVAAVAAAAEAGNPSGPPSSTRPRAGPSRRASRSLSSTRPRARYPASRRVGGRPSVETKQTRSDPLLRARPSSRYVARTFGEPDAPGLPERIGGPWRTRTSDPLIKSQLLYQLS